MPIYEYVCKQCGHGFESLVQGARRVDCPKCDSEDLEKVMSAFSAPAAAKPRGGPGGSCSGPCGPSGCG